MIRATFIAIMALTHAAWSEPRPDMGRIAHAGLKTFSHCTASRLAGGSIVTAAHCLPPIAADPIHLGLGYDRGDYAALVTARGTDYQVLAGRDVAIFCAGTGVPGLDVTSADTVPNRVTIWGYGRPFVHILNRKTCDVARAEGKALILDCAATPGTSGGPVTIGTPPVVVGIVSRASRTRTVVERLDDADLAAACPR